MSLESLGRVDWTAKQKGSIYREASDQVLFNGWILFDDVMIAWAFAT